MLDQELALSQSLQLSAERPGDYRPVSPPPKDTGYSHKELSLINGLRVVFKIDHGPADCGWRNLFDIPMCLRVVNRRYSYLNGLPRDIRRRREKPSRALQDLSLSHQLIDCVSPATFNEHEGDTIVDHENGMFVITLGVAWCTRCCHWLVRGRAGPEVQPEESSVGRG
jgi:hypothetical protein